MKLELFLSFDDRALRAVEALARVLGELLDVRRGEDLESPASIEELGRSGSIANHLEPDLKPEEITPAPPSPPTSTAQNVPEIIPAAVPEPIVDADRPARKGSPWTPARRAVIADDYPRGRPLSEIHEDLLALPGPPVQRSAIGIYAAHMGLSRPARGAAAAAPAVPPPPAQPDEAVWRVWSSVHGGWLLQGRNGFSDDAMQAGAWDRADAHAIVAARPAAEKCGALPRMSA